MAQDSKLIGIDFGMEIIRTMADIMGHIITMDMVATLTTHTATMEAMAPMVNHMAKQDMCPRMRRTNIFITLPRMRKCGLALQLSAREHKC